MLHLHCVDDWLDLCVQNLFNDSLDPVMRQSAVGTVCPLSTCCEIFGIFCRLLRHLCCLHVDDLFNDLFWDPGTSRSIGM